MVLRPYHPVSQRPEELAAEGGQVLQVPRSSKSPSPEQAKTYRVRKGDSPYLVAQRYQMNLAEFLSLNDLTPRSTIYPGQTLLVREN